MNAPDLDPNPGPRSPRISVCAWCGTPISRSASVPGGAVVPEDASGDRGETTVTHGICSLCVKDLGSPPIESLETFDRARFDDLPFGVIEVDAGGRVLTYNRWEEELANRNRAQVLGRNFFSQVAPCTGVAEFEGRYLEMVAAGVPARDQLEFLFRFPDGDVMVSVALAWAPDSDRGFILVQKVAE
jgi:photoactive yellow protein